MANISSSVTAASSGAPAIVTTAGGPDGAPPVTIAAFQNADVLIVAVPHGLGAGGGSTGVPARRPVRPQPSAGWAPTIYTAVAKKAAGSGASKKATTSTSKSTASASKSSSTSTSTGASSAKSSDPLAFLKDSKLSVEEKLFKFLCWVSEKNEKELLKKMDDIYAKQKKTESSSDGKGFLGDVLGGAGKAIGDVFGGKGDLGGLLGPVFSKAGIAGDLLGSVGITNLVGQITGPALAAGASMLGFPMLAPALMKLGPALAQGAMSLVGGATSQASGGGGTGSGTSTSTTREKDGTISQTDMMELQWLQEKQKEAFGTISNTLKAIHDTKMAVINNLRA